MTRDVLQTSAAIARVLIDNNITNMFGLVGEGNLFIANSFVHDWGGNYIAAGNEAGAVMMACGFASVSGEIGVATVTHGPGLTNTMTCLVEAVRARLPIVLVCGDTAVEDSVNFQKINQRELVFATGAGFEQVRSAATALQDTAHALRRAVIERKAIVLNVPVDIQTQELAWKPTPARIPQTRGLVPASDDIDNAVGIIAASRAPIVVAGRGAIRAETRASLVRLAERIGAPLMTTVRSKDLFRGEPFNLGICGTLSSPEAVEIVLASDCIISFGAAMGPFTTSMGSFIKDKRIIYNNVDGSEIGKRFTPDAGLIGDAGLVADAIVDLLDMAEIPPSGFRDVIAARPEPPAPLEEDLGTSDTMDIRRLMDWLNETLPSDRIFVGCGGRYLKYGWKRIAVDGPASLVNPAFGAIGFGMAQSIGAAVARRDRPVLMLAGDGSFMLGGVGEFNTAVRYGLDIIVVVVNDGAYGAEHRHLRNHNLDPQLTMFKWPEFADVAVALGGQGVTVRGPSDLPRAAQAIRDRAGPLLIDVKIDPDRIPAAA
jgi:thiamine pyrophosphate-dependent acetolactate synthase large subunit-like protein